MTEVKNGNTEDAGRREVRAGKRDTSRIELTDAEADDRSSARDREPLSVRKLVGDDPKIDASKSSTSRISLDEAKEVSDDERIEMGKDATVRVDLTGAMARLRELEGATGPGAGASADAEDEPPSATARISLGGEAGAPAKQPRAKEDERPDATARIVLESAEPASSAAEPPRTVRLKRPSTTPRTVVMNRPSGTEPRTVVLKQATEEDATATTDSGREAGEKGSTTHIQIPDSEVPAASSTGRKTIRIKRSGGGGSPGAKTLTIARPARKDAAVTVPAGSEDAALGDLQRAVADQPGTLFVLLAIAAVLVVCALLYLLAAQTIATGLTIPGVLA